MTLISFLCGNIPVSPAYGVYISQLIRYSRACSKYQDFLARSSILTHKLSNKGYEIPKLKTFLKKCYGRHHELFDPYRINRFTTHYWRVSIGHQDFCFPNTTFTSIVLNTDFENLDVTTGDTCVAEDAHSSGTPDPTPGFIWSSCRPYVSSICCFVICLVTLVLPY